MPRMAIALRWVAFLIVSLLLLILVLTCGGCQSARPTYEIKTTQEGGAFKTEFSLKGSM